MTIWRVTGGRRLTGELPVQGSKNAVLPILAASILAPCETLLTGVPDLRDVRITLRILRHLGCVVTRERDHIWIDSRPLHGFEIPHSLMRELRSSVIFLGDSKASHIEKSTPVRWPLLQFSLCCA